MNKRKKALIIITALILLVFIYLYSTLIAEEYIPQASYSPPPNSQNVPRNRDPLMENLNDYIRGGILLLTTSIGIFFNILWEREPNDRTPLLDFNSLKPLLISPIIFGSIYFAS